MKQQLLDGQDLKALRLAGRGTFQSGPVEGGAEGPLHPAVGADVGQGVLALGHSQQRRPVVDERLPALVLEVNDVLCGVSVQEGEPARKR